VTSELRIHIDGASRGNPGPASAGVSICNSKNKVVSSVSEYIGVTTNNVAEYFSLIYALQEALRLQAKQVLIFTDSELLSKQWSGEYKVKDPVMKLMHRQAQHLRKYFEDCQLSHVPREENKEADRLANEALEKRDTLL
jgi:ribonuclease HI